MSIENPFAMHYQSVWLERVADRRFPAWARVAFLAFGSHKANGHARFKPGQVGLLLGAVNPDTGEVKPMDKHNVQRAIRVAIESGWLREGSSSLCLVVPAHAIRGGEGRAHAPCPLHETKAGRNRPSRTVGEVPVGESPTDPPSPVGESPSDPWGVTR